ncbi:MAG: DUF3747 domain-containing protein [Cyanobacteria bacterium P01_E01_bin.34]
MNVSGEFTVSTQKLLATCCAVSIASLGGAALMDSGLLANASEFDFSAPTANSPTSQVPPLPAPAPIPPTDPSAAPTQAPTASPSAPALAPVPDPAVDPTATEPNNSSSLFAKTEVDGEDFLVMAAPRGLTGDYFLMIVEQQSDQQACWQENGTAPIEVDPLLLTFDYTGICGRMADSNAYSIRMADNDLGLNYSLRVVPQDGELLLRGYANNDFSAPPIEIARTYGVSNTGFTRFVFNPGWRLTRRVFEERELGHIYLTSDLPLGAGEPVSRN